MPSALIIGATGQDGRLLTELLLGRGYAVRGWTRTTPLSPTLCECASVDLLNATAVETELRQLQPDEVYYLAAFHHSTEERIELSKTELLERSLQIHLFGLQNVLEAINATSRRTRLFYAASSHVFGTPRTPEQDEQTPLLATSPYGISKAAGLRCCQVYREREGLFAAAGILFNQESTLRPASFLSQKIIRGALKAKQDPAFKLVLGDLAARTDWGYAPDYVDAMFRILQLPHASDFVVATGETHTVQEFADIAFDEVGLDWRDHVKTDPGLLKKPALPL